MSLLEITLMIRYMAGAFLKLLLKFRLCFCCIYESLSFLCCHVNLYDSIIVTKKFTLDLAIINVKIKSVIFNHFLSWETVLKSRVVRARYVLAWSDGQVIICFFKYKYCLLWSNILIFSHHHEFLYCSLGFLDVKKVDILWNNQSKVTNSRNGFSGELYLRVTLSSEGSRGRFWGVLLKLCHKIMHIIDWTRSHTDNINHFSSAYGIDAGWQYFFNVCMIKNFPSFVLGSKWNIWPHKLNLLACGFTCRVWHLQHLIPASPSFLSICVLLPIVCHVVESLWD